MHTACEYRIGSIVYGTCIYLSQIILLLFLPEIIKMNVFYKFYTSNRINKFYNKKRISKHRKVGTNMFSCLWLAEMFKTVFTVKGVRALRDYFGHL